MIDGMRTGRTTLRFRLPGQPIMQGLEYWPRMDNAPELNRRFSRISACNGIDTGSAVVDLVLDRHVTSTAAA